jgi:hypothetical protein
LLRKGENMKKLLLATVFALGLVNTASADSIVPFDDPLHGMVCNATGGGCSNLDNGTFAPITFGPNVTFAFDTSGQAQTGDLRLLFLIPDNEVPGTLPTINSTSISGGSAMVTALRAGVDWTGPAGSKLGDFIGSAPFNNGSPPNTFSAIFPSSQALDVGETGFFVFTIDVGLVTLAANSDTSTSVFFSPAGGLPVGTSILAVLNTDVAGGSGNGIINTASSGQLLVQPTAAVPGPIVGAGLPGLVAACAGLLALGRRRRRQQLA